MVSLSATGSKSSALMIMAMMMMIRSDSRMVLGSFSRGGVGFFFKLKKNLLPNILVNGESSRKTMGERELRFYRNHLKTDGREREQGGSQADIIFDKTANKIILANSFRDFQLALFRFYSPIQPILEIFTKYFYDLKNRNSVPICVFFH